ncbi:Enhancing lycopene biosynthesis protein 2 [Anaplasma phagocytophilum]|uniref:Enhancing lycopene biosynthesis protein 2 n=1 Tax=Anaplasma phagocytophilum TaxID=948 RepID=A0AA45UTK2_ANAPH|nr:isoprenoid biosynthesis glyoxalase ElbB [Anaplasma phagocytophilum]SBO14567.1 Enhancing lycopene biosynthesis protein 2 [Anaplasma phagocytophilum]SBO32259.1 Enhancing lycopene biosynthesis protein 2 [Anaplasma phagocytophilum]SBO32663.1 Enhancing lycopene biosynthesis protein 2 [Anaplasma phagocytophilum]SBO32706.1 Enhancing lycopene biosynthesis protein 2 [Anaplasma phagocytophilum]SCV64555.1 Enhancing lycopene biosynthesis protein 2 [Anaplasma phagocytophilum]
MNCAVLLCGCGHMDGSEIREAVLALLALDSYGINVTCSAPNIKQVDVIDHLSGSTLKEERDIMSESARIARGNVVDLKDISPNDFDMLILPGGFGVAKNYSDILKGESPVNVLEEVKQTIVKFHKEKKAIGAICIAPAIVAASLSSVSKVKVTLGEDVDSIISRCGGEHVFCETDDYVADIDMGVFSTPAYMRKDSLHKIHVGIHKMVGAMVDFVKKKEQL